MNKYLAMMAMGVALLSSQPAFAASYICGIKKQSQCTGNKRCKPLKSDDLLYFIINTDNQSIQECRLENCNIIEQEAWPVDDAHIFVSREDAPSITRLMAFDDKADFTRATLSSVLTVVQSGDCTRQVSIPRPTPN